jgi:cytochrome c-type biogenesis protein CcmH
LTFFLLACVGLLLLSGLFYLRPKKDDGGADADLERANVEWYRVRQTELAREGAVALEDDARLRLLEDEQNAAAPPRTASVSEGFPVWVLLPLVAVFSGTLYFWLGAAPDVLIARQLQNIDENSTPGQMQALITRVEVRSAQRPENLDYVNLLGRYYMGQEEYSQAAQSYAELARELPEDAYALASAAQAEYLAAGRQLSSQARLRAEQALAVDPHQRTALGLLGMASFEQQQYRAAISYWQRLLVVEQPDSDGARMIASVIETARQRLAAAGELPDTAAVAVANNTVEVKPPAADPTPGVTVRVELPQGAELAPSDTVFVLARNADSDSRMPIAVQRLQAGQLPLTLRLDDSNSMAGQKLSGTESIVVVVQVSPSGTPGEAGATWLGKGGPLPPSLDLAPLEIVLQPRG